MPRPLKIFAPGRELGSDSTRPMTRLAEHSRGVLRCAQGADGRRYGALFGARAGAVGGTHSTGRRARFCVLCSRGRRPPCLLLLLRPQPGTLGRVE
jgi:hypothetical protein